MNISLNQTVPSGQTWKFKISNGKQYKVYSSSKYLLYELTDNNLVITARKEASNGDNVVLVNGDQSTTYTLNKQAIPIPTTETFIAYYGNTSTEMPSTYTDGTSKVITDGTFEFIANNKIAWFALPQQLEVNDVIETMFGTSWKGDIPELTNAVVSGDYRMYHINFEISTPHSTNLKIIYTK